MTQPLTLDQEGYKAMLDGQLDIMAKLWAQHKPDGWKYGCLEELVQKEGRFFSSKPYTSEEKVILKKLAGEVGLCHAKTCYYTTFLGTVANVPGVEYAEGFGLGRIHFPVDHAWLVLNDKAVDFTWGGKLQGRGALPERLVERAEKNLSENVYKGVIIPRKTVLAHAVTTRTASSVLVGWLRYGGTGGLL